MIAGSLTAMVALTYDSLAVLKRLAANLDFATPEYLKPPPWLIAIASGVVALFVTACLSRRVRAALRMRPRLSRPSAHGQSNNL